MSIRDIAAADRAHAIKSSMFGVGEATTWIKAAGGTAAIVAAWDESPNDKRDPHGLASGQFGQATVDVVAADVVGITRADRLTRAATGVTWDIEHIEPIPGTGFRLHMSRRDEEST